VNVISRKKLREFWEGKPERQQHATAFESWFKLARKARWHSFADVKATFGQADIARGETGRTATIFDIGGNKYRVLAHVDYLRQVVKIEAVLDHKEYDRNLWKKLFGAGGGMATTKLKKARAGRDNYMELVRRFPLKTIKNDAEHERAAGIISELMGRDIDAGSGDYLDALIVLVSKYEDENHGINEEMTPQNALRALMEANKLNQAAIGQIIGSESAVSMFFKGDRKLSKAQIRRLAERFKIDPTVFMD
jgi:mRNA interferase HigB